MGTKIIYRKRIDLKLENIFRYPLSIVHAPMGYGKTTAVNAFLKQRDINLAWIPLVASGGSVDYLWNRMTDQMIKNNLHIGHALKKLGFPYDGIKTTKALDILIDCEYERPVVIVFDDFQTISDPRAFSFIRLFAQQKIQSMHIVLITRDLSMIGAAGLYQKQLCFTLTEKSLKFTRAEVQRYFSLMGCDLSEENLDEVYSCTDGWISMVYIMMDSMQRGLPAGKNDTVDDIIEQNFYEPLDDKLKETFLKLSFLNTFTMPMAAYVLDEPDVLQAGLKKSAFLVYNELDKNYSIRNPLREFLVEKAKLCRIEFNLLYKRAGEWYLNEKQYPSAFDFLNRAEGTEIILSELNKENTPDIHFTQFTQIHRIFDNLTEEQCLKYPIAYLQYIRIFAMSGAVDAVRKCRSGLEKMEEYVRNSDLNAYYKSFLMGEINVVRTFVIFNDLEEMIRQNQKAVEYFFGGCSCIVTRKKEFTFGSPHLLCCYYREAGKLKHTTDFLINKCESLIASINGCGTGCDSVAMAEYALETGELNAVELHAYKAIYKAKSEGQVCLMISAKFVLARLAILRGDNNMCSTLMESLRNEVLSENNPVLNTTFDICTAYLNACMRNVDDIPAWIRNGNESAASFLYQGKPFYYVVYGQAVLLSGDYIKLDALCETSLSHFARFNNQLCFLHCYIHEAVAQKHIYGNVAGRKALVRALEIGEADNIIFPFAENAPHILDLLMDILAEKLFDKKYMNRIISCCHEYISRLENLNSSSVSLTGREKETLRLLEKGYKHEEIGGELFISVTTVRFHIKNIYQKLGINNKILAIRKAKELNLI